MRTHRPTEAGAALVELAVAFPLLALLIVGTTDFARAFYTGIELINAARAAAQYGAQDLSHSADTATMQTIARTAGDLPGVTAVASRSCRCASDDGVAIGGAVSCTTSCTGGQHLITTVTVDATSSFSINSALRLAGVPRTFQIQRSATLRVPD